jgi:hypothetical protein
VETENSIAPNTRALNANVLVPSLISIGEKQKIIEAKKATAELLLEPFKISTEEKKRKRLRKVSTMAPKKGSIFSIQFLFRKDKIQ